jgi:hypothetical protein
LDSIRNFIRIFLYLVAGVLGFFLFMELFGAIIWVILRHLGAVRVNRKVLEAKNEEKNS